jgi:hypothetical protein
MFDLLGTQTSMYTQLHHILPPSRKDRSYSFQNGKIGRFILELLAKDQVRP